MFQKGSPYGWELAKMPLDPAVRDALELAADQQKCAVTELRRRFIYEGLDRLLGEGWRVKVKRL